MPTTDWRRPQSPARRSKIVTGALSAGALVAIVTGLAATSQGGPVTPTSGAVSGGGPTVTGTFPAAGPAVPVAVPAPVPAVAPARSTPTVPHAVSKASGG